MIKTFNEIYEIDKKLACLFTDPDDAVRWIYAIEGGIKDWIEENNKQCWEVVRYVTEKRGIAGCGKHKKQIKLTRENFAELLIKFCPSALKKDDTVSALKTSMDHYKYNDELKGRKKVLESSYVTIHIKTVENLLDGQQIDTIPHSDSPTIEDLLYKYLKKEIETPQQSFPYSRVIFKPQYENIKPTISIETYKSQSLLDKKEPTHIEVYEFIDEQLTLNKLHELVGMYDDERGVKLFIVSKFGISSDVRLKTKEKRIGYIRINPNKDLTDDIFVLPRSIEDYERYYHDLMVLKGEAQMNYPLLIDDGSLLTSSLIDVLLKEGVAVNPEKILNIPYISKDEIEQKTYSLIADLINERNNQLIKEQLSVLDLSINPFSVAQSNGLTYEIKELTKLQLGRLDLVSKRAFINSIGENDKNRFRFTMAHELGHFMLHLPLFEEAGLESFGETDSTLAVTNENIQRVEFQANYFASCLLMPVEIVVRLYYLYYDKYVRQKFGGDIRPLYYSPKQPETYSSYNNVVGRMSKVLAVSKKALSLKLKSLNLLLQDN